LFNVNYTHDLLRSSLALTLSAQSSVKTPFGDNFNWNYQYVDFCFFKLQQTSQSCL